MNIIYRVGDLLHRFILDKSSMFPFQIIVNTVNDKGIIGNGFAFSVFDRFPDAKANYMKAKLSLGANSNVQVMPNVVVCNLCAKQGRGKLLDTNALEVCLNNLRLSVNKSNKPIELLMPRIGTGNSGHEWDEVLQSITKVFNNSPIPLRVYKH